MLADEINRATPKTQSALLEAMQERTVTSGTTTHELEPPFLVMATQNPIEMEGTYPLPEAQLDRFLMKILVTLSQPRGAEPHRRAHHPARGEPQVQPVLDREAILEVRAVCRAGAGRAARAGVSPSQLVMATQPEQNEAHELAQASTSATAARRAARRRWSSAAGCWR